MSDGEASLERRIRERHARDEPVLDALVFGSADPAEIARQIGTFCRAHVGSPIERARFYRTSVGCVAGLDLADGRSVVVKAHRGGSDPKYLEATMAIRRHLADAGFPCPRPIAGPARMDHAWATADTFEERGACGDAHDPDVRRAIAESLAELTARAAPFVSHPALRGAWFTSIPEGRTFPRPHSPIFDFDATRAGAEWIEELAVRARSRRADARGRRVVGHFDWRVEHLRFEGGRVVMSFDWDSLHAELEPVLVGATAHAFTADWEREEIVCTPTIAEIRAFVGDYERARGAAFGAAERATIAASCVYSLAYTARCDHALHADREGGRGDFRPLLRAHGNELLTSGI